MVNISSNKTLGQDEIGEVVCITAEADIKFPHEDTYKCQIGDRTVIISATDNNVDILGETGVTMQPLSNAKITAKGSSVTVEYKGGNTYLMW